MAETMTKYKAEKVLELSGSYTFKDLTSAYRKAVKANHPDMGGSEEKMIEVNAAKSYLDGFFSDDKNATVTCSSTDTSSRTSGAAATASAWTASNGSDSSSDWDADFADFVNSWADTHAANHANSAHKDTASSTESARKDGKSCRAKCREDAFDAKTVSVKTKFGWVSCEDHPEWIGVVGVPYKYSDAEDQNQWEQMNKEAEEAARAQATDAANTSSNDYAYQAAYAATAAAVNVAANKAEHGFFSSYKRNDIKGAPKWWTAANWMASKFQWRISFWLVMLLITLVIVDNASLSMTAAEALTVTGCAFASVLNIFGLFTSPVRRAVRKIADSKLVTWAAARGMRVDWEHSQLVKA